MPLDAGAIGIRPLNQPQRTGGTDGVQRRDDGSASGGFRPQTNVALRTAVDDMAGLLSRISTSERFGLEKMPDEVSQIVRNVLQQAFSMESTLEQGVGSTLESQRFSMEQLSVFARMLSQIGALAEKGFSMELSSETEVLLKNFKNLLVSEEGGNALEPVLMSKASFELIDSKNAVDLPQALYSILAQLAQGTPTQLPLPPQQQSEGMAFLKQLIKYFMPRSTDSGSPQQSEEGQNGSAPRGQQSQGGQSNQPMTQTQARQFLQSMFRNIKAAAQGLPNAQQSNAPTQNQPTPQSNQQQQSTPQSNQQQQPSTQQFNQQQQPNTQQFNQQQQQPTPQFNQQQQQPTQQFNQQQHRRLSNPISRNRSGCRSGSSKISRRARSNRTTSSRGNSNSETTCRKRNHSCSNSRCKIRRRPWTQ